MELPDEDDRPRRARPAAGTPAWVWVAVGGAVVFGGLVALCCGGLYVLPTKPARNADPGADGLVKWGEWKTFGPIRVRIESAEVQRYMATSPAGHQITSSSPSLLLKLRIETDDATKEHTARASVDVARVRDTLGNELRYDVLRTEFGAKCDIDGQLQAGRTYVVRSDKPLTDLLAFSRPVEAASTLTVAIPARNFGGTGGDVVFEIPEDQWKSGAGTKSK